jgi:uncharacterized membrane protein YoaK (UPF0700 family)
VLRLPEHGRTAAGDRALAGSLSAIAGAANAVALRAAGVFSANVTGNVSWAADRLAAGRWAAAGFFLAVVVAFVAGSFACAFALAAAARRTTPGAYATCLRVESVALAALAIGCAATSSGRALDVLCLGLAFLMGGQNALATRLSDARVRATHLSGICTDLGISLGVRADLALHGAAVSGAESDSDGLVLRLLTVACFLVGGAFGALAYAAMGLLALLPVAAAVALVAIVGARALVKRAAIS